MKRYKIIGLDKTGTSCDTLTININNNLCKTDNPKIFNSFRSAYEYIKEHQKEYIHDLHIVEV